MAAAVEMPFAQDAPLIQKCSAISEAKARLACFDEATRAKPESDDSANASTPEGPSTSTKDIVKTPNFAESPTELSYREVDHADLYITPGKFEGKGIELKRMRCFHADKDEYRCIAPGSTVLAVFATEILPVKEREGIENDCGEFRKVMTSSKCLKTIRFVPIKHSEDIVNGYQKRTLILARSLDIMPDSKSRRK